MKQHRTQLIAVLTCGIVAGGMFLGHQSTQAARSTKRERITTMLKQARLASKNHPHPPSARPPKPKTEPSWAYKVEKMNPQWGFHGSYDSIWQAGSVPEYQRTIYGAFLVYTMHTKQEAFIGTREMNPGPNAAKYTHLYPCPSPNTGKLTIVGISGQNGIIRLTAASGISGTFNLKSHAWSFVSSTSSK